MRESAFSSEFRASIPVTGGGECRDVGGQEGGRRAGGAIGGEAAVAEEGPAMRGVEGALKGRLGGGGGHRGWDNERFRGRLGGGRRRGGRRYVHVAIGRGGGEARGRRNRLARN
jgi:hypothetical protein